jgi:2-oxo-4-hydroxy-4-carboxy-5-ureidoimidazoline decarboxylase
MNHVLARWNRRSAEEAAREIVACCGSTAWARKVAERRPLKDEASLLAASDEIWRGLEIPDWMEAFSKHPRIGERKPPQQAAAKSLGWSEEEQRKVGGAGDSVRLALAEGNREYERRFQRVFIVCATGKSGPEILEILNRRLQNDEATELQEAVEEQRKIVNIRLKKWILE